MAGNVPKAEGICGLDEIRFTNIQDSPLSHDSSAETKDWQTSRKIRKRTRFVLEHYDMNRFRTIPMDICFRVGPDGATEDIWAHKFMLALGTPDFLAMFYTPGQEIKEVICMPQIQPAGFRIMLLYLYSEEVDNMTIDNVMDTLLCAKMFGIPKLADDCRDFIQENLTTDNCCLIYSKAMIMNELSLSLLASAIICSRTEKVLATAGFLQFSELMLNTFLQMEELSLDEFAIYQGVRRWMHHNRDPTDERSFRETFAGFMNHIRLPLFTPAQIANGPVADNVLTDPELKCLFKHLFAIEKPEIAYPTMLRMPRPQPFYVTFQLTALILDPYSDDDYEDEMELDNTVVILGQIVLELRADLLPVTCQRFRNQITTGQMLSIAYGKETFDRDTEEVEGLEEDERVPVETRLIRHIPGTVMYVCDEGEVEASASDLQIVHVDKGENRFDPRRGLAFGRVVAGLTVLDQTLKFEDGLGEEGFPLQGYMPRVEFHFGDCRILETWTPATTAGDGPEEVAAEKMEDDEVDFDWRGFIEHEFKEGSAGQ